MASFLIRFLHDRLQVASTSVCAATGSSGVPVGTQIATPVMMATGCPCDST